MACYFNDMKIGDITDDILDGYQDSRNSFYITGEGKEMILANKNRVNAKTQSSNNIKKKFSYGTVRGEASVINKFFLLVLQRRSKLNNKDIKNRSKWCFQ